ncbi:MAG TPA: xanthine dehydrogenase family protein molybdopterin-binding subunit, partial [Pseudolabrys sp.]
MNSTLAHRKAELRLEDDALVRGAGKYADDPRLPHQAAAAFVRSPHASARIVSIDAGEARSAKGVVAVLTAEDITAAGLKSAGRHPPLPGRGGKELVQPFRPTLAGERVRFVGEAVAMVVAETLGQAQDAADLITVEYEETPAVIDPREAEKPGAPQVHADAPGNLAIDWPGVAESADNEREVDQIIKSAPHVARVTVRNQRMVVASMETRGATGVYDAKTESYTLYACS